MLWKKVIRPGQTKPTKVPFQPDGRHASHDDPSTWVDFNTATTHAKQFDGIGFVFTEHDPYAGIDLDNCFSPDGTLLDWAVPIVAQSQDAEAYIERTPSGQGLHIIGQGKLPGKGRKITGLGANKTGAIEIYDRLRYFTVTGDQTDLGAPEGSIESLLNNVWRSFGLRDDNLDAYIAPGVEVTDAQADAMTQAMLTHSRSDFLGLWNGVYDAAKHGDDRSRARMALLAQIALKLSENGIATPAQVKAVALRSPFIRQEMTKARNQKWPRLADEECKRAVLFASDKVTQMTQEALPGDDILINLDETVALRPLDSIIRGILQADSVGMVWGAPGSFKSFLSIDWALCVATGTPWIGHEVVKAPVWYLCGEGQAGLRTRVAAWRKARQYEGDLSMFFHTKKALLLDDDGTGSKSSGLVRLLQKIADGEVPSLIVVDTLARSMAGDESATKDANRYVSALDELVAAVRKAGQKCTVVLVHHSKKDGESYRGSSVLRGAADFEFEIDKMADYSVSFKCHKIKDGVMPQEIILEAKAELLGAAQDNFGYMVEMSSLVLWKQNAQEAKRAAENAKSDAISRRHSALMDKAVESVAKLGQVTTKGLVDYLHANDVRFGKSDLPVVLDELVRAGRLNLVVGLRGTKTYSL